MEKETIKKITIELSKIGSDEEWFVVVDKTESQERFWVIVKEHRDRLEDLIDDIVNVINYRPL
jgi:hypothetical protein